MGIVVPLQQDYSMVSARDPASPIFSGTFFSSFSASAPTSPGHPRRDSVSTTSSAVPFEWEEIPGTPKRSSTTYNDNKPADEFAFDFNGQVSSQQSSLPAADELFVEGKIRPLKPPPRLYQLKMISSNSPVSSPRSPKSPKLLWRKVATAAAGKEDANHSDDPFVIAMQKVMTRERSGRELMISSASRSRKGSRSLSPPRSINILPSESSSTTSSSSTSTETGGSSRSKKWSMMKDLFLFRSFSLIFTSPKKKGRDHHGEDSSRCSSFRSTMSSTTAEEIRNKTALRYRQGLFACLRFSPAMNSISKNFDTVLSFSRS